MSLPKYDWKSGDLFGTLMLTGKSFSPKDAPRKVEAICECGTIKWYSIFKLRKGHTKSCGCQKDASIGEKNTKHGYTKGGEAHPIYASYSEMKRRCYDSKRESYVDYGGRGIIICDEWLNDFVAFKDWALANGWEEGLEIDRIENNGIYEPGNCRWSDDVTQSRNRRNTVFLEAFGEKKCVAEWATDNRCKATASAIFFRIKKLKWGHERAIVTPPYKEIAAFGETKSIPQWVLDERCKIGDHGLRDRILSGWDAELAIVTPNTKNGGSFN